jgi:hypothetical protein
MGIAARQALASSVGRQTIVLLHCQIRLERAGRNDRKATSHSSCDPASVRENAYATPTKATKGRFRPKKRHPTRDPPKHFRP